jgi:hypothetical protein
MELVTEPGVSLDAPQKWIEMLREEGFGSLRVRTAQRGEVGKVRQVGGDDRPHYSVTGIVTSGNVLKLPGANIRLHDKAALRTWVAKLHDGGEEGVVSKPVMYGLTAKQMLEVHDNLKGAVDFETKGQRTGDVLNRIADAIELEVQVDSAASDAKTSEEPVADELRDLSYGTALAAVLRPLGYVMVPEKKLGEKLHLRVTDSKSVERPWPIGWEPKQSQRTLAPDFFKSTNAEITDYVLLDALEAIQKRIQLPLLFDYNNLARQRIDLQRKVSTKPGRKSYAVIVDELLHQSQLKTEMRIDEAEKPFLWITTIKQR